MLLVGMGNGEASVESRLAVPRQVKHRVREPVLPLLGVCMYMPRRTENGLRQHLHACARISHKVETADGWIPKPWSLHTLEYYPAVKRTGALVHVPMWMNLETVMLREKPDTKGHITMT